MVEWGIKHDDFMKIKEIIKSNKTVYAMMLMGKPFEGGIAGISLKSLDGGECFSSVSDADSYFNDLYVNTSSVDTKGFTTIDEITCAYHIANVIANNSEYEFHRGSLNANKMNYSFIDDINFIYVDSSIITATSDDFYSNYSSSISCCDYVDGNIQIGLSLNIEKVY